MDPQQSLECFIGQKCCKSPTSSYCSWRFGRHVCYLPNGIIKGSNLHMYLVVVICLLRTLSKAIPNYFVVRLLAFIIICWKVFLKQRLHNINLRLVRWCVSRKMYEMTVQAESGSGKKDSIFKVIFPRGLEREIRRDALNGQEKECTATLSVDMLTGIKMAYSLASL